MPHILESIRSDVRDCIQNCTDCHQVCEETLTYCLEKGGDFARADHLRLLRDCIQICETSADFMLRNSTLHQRTCAVCAEICERCAESCDLLSKDKKLKTCAEVCRRCAASCREMAKL
jgi:hypothetical protein